MLREGQKKRLPNGNTPRWSELENYIFFNAIKEFGMNYSIISNLLINKCYRQIKRKIKREIEINESLFRILLHCKSNSRMRKKLIKLIYFNKMQN
mmetsp:Transcript_20449/g.32948  ORF Transcript_20449/g.32948 Transcript_20449/m.32948 type:complete len:95 (+) Transcript_20449:10918-11202(+)